MTFFEHTKMELGTRNLLDALTDDDGLDAQAILQLDEQLGRNFKIFREVDNPEPPSGGRGNLPYFL